MIPMKTRTWQIPGITIAKVYLSGPVLEITKLSKSISFEFSSDAKSKACDDLITYEFIPKTDFSADYRSLLKSFESHLQSSGLNHSKPSIGNIGMRPIREYLFTKMAVLKSGRNFDKHDSP